MFKKLVVTGFVFAALATSVLAQEAAQAPASPVPSRVNDQRQGHFRKRLARQLVHRNANRLGLTDEQRTQRQALRQKHLTATKSQREEMMRLREKRIAGTVSTEDQARARQLHQELRNSMMEMRKENYSLLTTEQRSRVEAVREQRQQKRTEMLRRRQELSPPKN